MNTPVSSLWNFTIRGVNTNHRSVQEYIFDQWTQQLHLQHIHTFLHLLGRLVKGKIKLKNNYEVNKKKQLKIKIRKSKRKWTESWQYLCASTQSLRNCYYCIYCQGVRQDQTLFRQYQHIPANASSLATASWPVLYGHNVATCCSLFPFLISQESEKKVYL